VLVNPNGGFDVISSGHTYAQQGSYTLSVNVVEGLGHATDDAGASVLGAGSGSLEAPVITAMADLAASTEVKGTGVAGTPVNLYDNGDSIPIATGFVGTDTTFDIFTAARLGQGTHILTATVTDGGTTSDPSTPVTDIVQNVGTATYGITTDINFTLASDEHDLTFLGTADLTGTGTGTKNVFTGNTGHNTFVGGPGDNDYFVRHSDDTITATLNTGHVNRVYASVDFTLPDNVQELVLLGSANLTGTGNSLDNVIYSNSGLDTLIGGGGNDTFVVHNSSDQVIASAGGNNAVFADVSFTLPAHVQTLVLTGSSNLTGTGNDLDDTIYSNSGVDTLIGGTGTNSFVVHNSNDVVIASPNSLKNSVFADVSFTLPANVQDLILFGSANTTGTGNDLDNAITANTGNGTLLGGGGSDKFVPGPGQNRIDGGTGTNSIDFTGKRAQYTVSGQPGGGLVIADRRDGAPDGIETVTNVQFFVFTDKTLTPSTPAVTATSLDASHGQSFAASSLFSVSDPLVDVMATYAFWDTGSGGGHFLLNGVDQGTNHEIDVTASQLQKLVYASGAGTDTLWVRVNNGFQWSAWSNAFTVSAPPDNAPVLTPNNGSILVSHNHPLRPPPCSR
jgi:RTX calcium-binding nonapeptide repeat (4 copies)